MNAETPDHGDWRCHLGRHHYAVVKDDNPERPGQQYLECTRCGKQNDPPTYNKPTPGQAAGMGMGAG